MLTIDVELLTGVVAILGAACGLIAALFKLMRRLERVEERARRNEHTTSILLRGLFAVLDGLQQQGCNGEVTAARKLLQEHLAGD